LFLGGVMRVCAATNEADTATKAAAAFRRRPPERCR
jgi:hypothetical protein